MSATSETYVERSWSQVTDRARSVVASVQTPQTLMWNYVVTMRRCTPQCRVQQQQQRISDQFTTSCNSSIRVTSLDDVSAARRHVHRSRMLLLLLMLRRRKQQISPHARASLTSRCHGDAVSHVTSLLTRKKFVGCHDKSVLPPSGIAVAVRVT